MEKWEAQNNKGHKYIWIILGFILIIVLIIIIGIIITSLSQGDSNDSNNLPIKDLYTISNEGEITINPMVYTQEKYESNTQEERLLDYININLIIYFKCIEDNIDNENIGVLCDQLQPKRENLKEIFIDNVTYYDQRFKNKMIVNIDIFDKDDKEEIMAEINQMFGKYSKIYNVNKINYDPNQIERTDLIINSLDCSENISFSVTSQETDPIIISFGIGYHNIEGERVHASMINSPRYELKGGETKEFSFEKEKFPISDISQIGIEELSVSAQAQNIQTDSTVRIFSFSKNCTLS
jgi:hypothetical protein